MKPLIILVGSLWMLYHLFIRCPFSLFMMICFTGAFIYLVSGIVLSLSSKTR
jgi:hypothetical protein